MQEVSFEELQLAVLDWGKEKGILANSTATAQFLKTASEVGELADALAEQDRHEIEDAYGDIVVTLILGSHLAGMDLVQCLTKAYGVISRRQGKMVNGVFVKNEQPA